MQSLQQKSAEWPGHLNRRTAETFVMVAEHEKIILLPVFKNGVPFMFLHQELLRHNFAAADLMNQLETD